AVPILIQVCFNSALAYWLNRRLGESHSVACPSALIGASNFFELAVAAALSLFGFQSGAALATVVGVLIEVPVMLLVVRVVNGSKGWYEAGAATSRRTRDRGHHDERIDLSKHDARHLAQHVGADPPRGHQARGRRVPQDSALEGEAP